jgi:type IV secretory pathway VirB4 component
MKSESKSHTSRTGLKPIELPLLLNQQVRVLFGLTGRQLLFITCGLATGVSLWEYLSPGGPSFSATLLVGCVCAIPALLAGVIAFVTMHGRPLEEWFFIWLAWLLTPPRLAERQQLLRTFVKIRAIQEDLVALDLGERGYTYQALLGIEGKHFDLMSADAQAMTIEAFQQLLNGLSYPVSIHIRLRRYTPLSSASIPEHLPKPLRHCYAHYLAFLSQLVVQKQPVRISYYLTVPADAQTAEKDEERRLARAKNQIAHRIHEINRQLARADLTARQLRSTELLPFYQDFFFTQKAGTMERDLSANAGDLPALLTPRSISISATRLAVEGKRTQHYLACLALTQLPRRVYPGWLHHLLTTNEPHLDISIHVQPHESDLITRRLRRKAVELGGALAAAHKQGEQHGNTITRHALKDVERVRDRLIRKDAHIYSITLLMLVAGVSRDDLKKRVERIRLALRSLDFQAAPLVFQHHLGYLSCLYGCNLLARYAHLLPTDGAATFYPFMRVPSMEGGVLLGTTGNGNLVSLDPYAPDHNNANLAILGIPGAGKSFCFKVILSRLAPQTSISVIDLEGEYTRWAQAVGGQKMCFTADSFHINPLEVSRQASPGPHTLRERVAAVAGLCALLIGENGKLSATEKALVLQCLLDTYVERGITDDPMTHTAEMPTMIDFYTTLKRKESSGDLCRRLAPYIHLFPKRTILPIEGLHVVYDLQQLPEDLRPAASYLIADRLWSDLQEQRHEAGQPAGVRLPHLVVIDEAWFLCKFESGAALLGELARRIRKYHGGLWLGTQQLNDLLSTEQGRNLLSLCETKILFKQDVASIDAIGTILHLSQAQMKFLQTARCGEALYLCGREALAVEIAASNYEAAMAQSLSGG